MATEMLERRFAAIGARVRIVKAPRRRRSRWQPTRLLDVLTDRRGEYFELRVLGPYGMTVNVVDQDREERCLLLLVRDGGEKSKFLCGLDERHWFVAAVPESASGVGSVEAAKEALQPASVRRAVARKRPRNRFARRNVAYVRQGEWFFLPRWTLEVDERDVLKDRPLDRGRGNAHVLEFACVRSPELYAKGSVTHPEHDTIVLPYWHRVLMNTEQGAHGMRHLGFLD